MAGKKATPMKAGKKSATKYDPRRHIVLPKSISKDEARWRAQDDARTLAQVGAIKSDPKRFSAAAREASRMAKEKASELRSLQSIAKKGE